MPATKTVVDMAGESVTIPANVERVGLARPVFCEIFMALGAGDKMAAIPPGDTFYWMKKVNPGIANISAPFALSGLNTEELLKARPDVVIFLTGDKSIDTVKAMGIPVIQVSTRNDTEVMQMMTIIGSVLGADESENASRYNEYYSGNVARVRSISNNISEDQKPSVLFFYGVKPTLMVCGNQTAINEYIQTAGGRNAAAEVTSGSEVSMEQVLKWNPDIIIANVAPGDLGQLSNDSSWNQLKAVKNGKVYINPSGVWSWYSKSAETPLEVVWLAKTIQPDRYQDIDMRQEVKTFYKKYFDYNLTEDEVDRILSARPPAA